MSGGFPNHEMSMDSCEAAISRAVGVGVLVGGTGVGVLVGGTGVGVFVGGTGVAVGDGDGVFVGGTGVAVGVGDGVFVGGTGVAVGDGVGVGGTGSSPQAIAAAAMPTANRHAQRMDGCLDGLFAGLGMLCLGSSSSVDCTISDRCRVLPGRGDAGMRAASARFYR